MGSQTLESDRYNDKHYYGKTEAIFGFGSKEIIMTRPFGNNARVADANGDNLGDLLVNADNYYCLNKTDIFTLLAFDDGSTPTGSISNKEAKYDDVHFMANSPYLNLYSAEKLVSDRADYDVSDLFRQHMRGLPASTGLNRITTDISTNWASSLIGATSYTYSTINGCTILQTNMTCAADQNITGEAPQVGDIVKSDTVTTKGVYIVAASGESSFPVTYTLSDSFTVETAETISFYRHPQFQIYKFTPAPASTYKYVAECSNRGTCDRASGLCNCFAGYSSDACQTQNSLAV